MQKESPKNPFEDNLGMFMLIYRFEFLVPSNDCTESKIPFFKVPVKRMFGKYHKLLQIQRRVQY